MSIFYIFNAHVYVHAQCLLMFINVHVTCLCAGTFVEDNISIEYSIVVAIAQLECTAYSPRRSRIHCLKCFITFIACYKILGFTVLTEFGLKYEPSIAYQLGFFCNHFLKSLWQLA